VAVQEARCASLALVGHLLKLYGKRGVLSARGGVEELAESNHMAVSRPDIWSFSVVCTCLVGTAYCLGGAPVFQHSQQRAALMRPFV
jgi:hypothetical protein